MKSGFSVSASVDYVDDFEFSKYFESNLSLHEVAAEIQEELNTGSLTFPSQENKELLIIVPRERIHSVHVEDVGVLS